MPRAATLEALASYGGHALVEPVPAEQVFGHACYNAATVLDRYRKSAEAWAATKAQITASTRFSDAGRKAEMGDAAHRALSEMGRHDPILERARGELAELVDAARQVSLNLDAAQVSLLSGVLAQLREVDPVLLPGVLQDAAAARDVLVLQAFFSAPRVAQLALNFTDEQLDQAREIFSGAQADRGVLARMRELLRSAEVARRGLVIELRLAAGIEADPLVLMAMGPAPVEAA